MLEELSKNPQKILILEDPNVPAEIMVDAIKNSKINCGEINVVHFGPKTPNEFPPLQLEVEKNGPENITCLDEKAYEYAKDADIIFTEFTPVSSRMIEMAKNLKVIMINRSGLENINVEYATKKNIPIVNCIRNANAVAEFAIGIMIDISRNITASNKVLHSGKWEREYPNSSTIMTLENSTVGLIGVGNIGQILAKKLAALGVHTILYDEFIDEETLKKRGLTNFEYTKDLDYLLGNADFVSLHLRYCEATKNWFTLDKFKKMKKTAYFFNLARGGILNYNDLNTAIEQKMIMGAGLDVFDVEPLPEDYPLLKHDNVIMVPHLAGTTIDSLERSPYIVCKAMDELIEHDIRDRVVNLKGLKL